VSIVVLLLKHNHGVVLIPLSPTEVPELGQSHPPLPPLPKVVVNLGTTDLIATKLLQSLGNLIEVDFLEALVSPNTSGNELAHLA
jgi:hypothetical protein